MKSLGELKKVQEQSSKMIKLRDADKKYRVSIALSEDDVATSRTLLNSLVSLNAENNYPCAVIHDGNVAIRGYEPVMIVEDKVGNKSVYVNVDIKKLNEIFNSHILSGEELSQYTLK